MLFIIKNKNYFKNIFLLALNHIVMGKIYPSVSSLILSYYIQFEVKSNQTKSYMKFWV